MAAWLGRVLVRVCWLSDHDDDGGGGDDGSMMARHDRGGSGDESDGQGSVIVNDQSLVPLLMELLQFETRLKRLLLWRVTCGV